MEKITPYLTRSTVFEKGIVKAWEEDIFLPTYETGREEKTPVFLEKRVYQGSSGVVYPYPVIEKIADEKRDKLYHVVFIENYYLKVMILPSLGGRIHMAFNKIRNQHLVYYNQVIKPALVGLAGPWISGGIEFNWPQHHRPGTFLPTEHMLEYPDDGSIIVWCNEIERMSGTKARHGCRLYPDKAYIEIDVHIYNRTPYNQSFLWWANPAVAVNEHYQSVFPPDVHLVFDHGKRDTSEFPIARGTYYKQDYSSGVDISWYKNIPVPTSYMAIRSDFDFVGGYDHSTGTGLLHVADHHISPGKKQWTWGTGRFGAAWEKNLTDEDGPYIELMTGVFTDNQPDFSWLAPFEEKSWKQFFMPYSEAGVVKNANKDAILNYKITNDQLDVVLYTTSEYKNLQLRIQSGETQLILDPSFECCPETPYQRIFSKPELANDSFTVEILSKNREILISYSPVSIDKDNVPKAANAPLMPKEIKTNEQLYLTGLHLEQYRHSTYNPLDYYREALLRDPMDIRCNNAVGCLMLRQARFDLAQPHFSTALQSQTALNLNPSDGRPGYNLGLTLLMQDKLSEAYQALYKSAWNKECHDAAMFLMSQIACRQKNWMLALEHIEASLTSNSRNHKARQLKASILRKTGRTEEARIWGAQSYAIDPFSYGCLYEMYLTTGNQSLIGDLLSAIGQNVHVCLEYAIDYGNAGLYEEALDLLSMVKSEYPLRFYAKGYYLYKMGRHQESMETIYMAGRMSPVKCFPNKSEETIFLNHAITVNPDDPKAPYYLGNFWYSVKQYDLAIECWETSVRLDDTFPTALRNLALAVYNKKKETDRAVKLLVRAFSLDSNDSRVLMELDQLYKKTAVSPTQRFRQLKLYQDLVAERDDLLIEYIALHNQLGYFERAMGLLKNHRFHPWEGGEGKIITQFIHCRIELARKALGDHHPSKALALLNETDILPENLGEDRLPNSTDNEIQFFKGLAWQELGNEKEAHQCFLKAASGIIEPAQVMYYNDSQPDSIYFQGRAWQMLGNELKALSCFRKLLTYGEQHLNDHCSIDYFAVSLPDLAIWDEDLNIRHKVHCYYMIALGCLGLGDTENATHYYRKAIRLNINHTGTQTHQILKIKNLPR